MTLLISEISYNVWADLARLSDEGVHLSGEQITAIVFNKIIPLIPNGKTVDYAEFKARKINTARSEVQRFLEENRDYTGAVFSPQYSSVCRMDLMKKQNVILTSLT